MGPSPKLHRTRSSNPDDEPIIRLSCQVQDYSFGKKGTRSLAARYALANEAEGNFKIDEEQTYGEIWMGDHEDGSSRSLKTSVHLRTLIEKSPHAFLTNSIATKFPGPGNNPQLPFLFKVLSFDRALPLQAYPNKSLAEQLQKQESEEKANNDKSDVAVALSPVFESFVGFRPAEEIKCFLRDVEELREVLGEEDSNIAGMHEQELDRSLKEIFGRIFKKDKAVIEKSVKKLLSRVKTDGDKALGEIGERDELGYVVQKVWKNYAGDPGIFAAVFFLNFVSLKRGEAVAVPPNCLRAYLDGDIIECMANSEHVPSRGFQEGTSPLDISDMLVNMLLHNPGPSKHLLLAQTPYPKSRNSHTTKFEIPMEEFSILKISLNRSEEEFIAIDGPAIYVVTAGEVEISARSRPDRQLSEINRETGTPGPTETVASEGGHVPSTLARRGSECSKTGDEGQREHLKEGMSVFVKPGFEIGFWNRGGGRAEVHAAYCEIEI
ncbi:hypothetical protein H072_10094 [Dactylellina haptotyla CBS 200.50]|uniref:Mannose-6-phosphate isomerase n=1 Tax=Dactylellina haptotyla (strain CBS 200.50) TaxID=1284197 RepID=S8A0A4_DACHA|nr:hypothetical protein H072_10094 [Dactylellina haptotyla CBS 200.50]